MGTTAINAGLKIGETSVPTNYFSEASSINFGRSVRYGFGVLYYSIIGGLRRLHQRPSKKETMKHRLSQINVS
jgi:hypothetical protein